MATPARPQLIVNADDLGLSAPVNDGIVEAHRAGIVTAASLMAVGRAFDHAVACCREVPALDIGVHLTVVGETALIGTHTSLADGQGRFPAGAGAFVKAFAAGTIRRADVRAEWAAQIEKILATGLALTHLDSHQHLHALPGLAEIALGLAVTYRIPFVRVPLERPRAYMLRPKPRPGRLAGWLALCAAWTVSRRIGPASPPAPRFLGFYHGGRLDAKALADLLATLQPGIVYELMCHPGYRPVEAAYRGWHYGHEGELKALTAPGLKERLAQRGIVLTRFADLCRR